MSTTYLYSEQTQAQDELFKAHAAFLCEVRNAPRTCKSGSQKLCNTSTTDSLMSTQGTMQDHPCTVLQCGR